MNRLHDDFLPTLDAIVGLQNKAILEIGCGGGNRSVDLAELCTSLSAIDPDAAAVESAKKKYAAQNLTYSIGSAENLMFDNDSFDLIIFSLSLHHVPIEQMHRAIEEAARVTKPVGQIVFLEPGFNGSFFDAEIIFGASDGDERQEKAAAHLAILKTALLTDELEYYDTIQFEFESVQDFIDHMEPRKNLKSVERFLVEHNYILGAQRRINIFSIV
jgi:ubiquinone/menaquinone biosynthesis C-methylase UbiE